MSVWQRHLSHAVVEDVAYYEVTIGIYRQPFWTIETGVRALPVVTSLLAVAAQSRDCFVCGRHLADAVVSTVTDIDGTMRVHLNSPGRVEKCSCAHAVYKAPLSAARDCRDGALEHHPAQAVVAVVNHQQVAIAIQRQPADC